MTVEFWVCGARSTQASPSAGLDFVAYVTIWGCLILLHAKAFAGLPELLESDIVYQVHYRNETNRSRNAFRFGFQRNRLVTSGQKYSVV